MAALGENLHSTTSLLHTANPAAPESDPDLVTALSAPVFTHLSARITQEERMFAVSIRMYCSSWEQDRAWGEKAALSIEAAGEIIATIAARHAIPQERITIHLVMMNLADGTRH